MCHSLLVFNVLQNVCSRQEMKGNVVLRSNCHCFTDHPEVVTGSKEGAVPKLHWCNSLSFEKN